jgi:hypothetical protein
MRTRSRRVDLGEVLSAEQRSAPTRPHAVDVSAEREARFLVFLQKPVVLSTFSCFFTYYFGCLWVARWGTISHPEVTRHHPSSVVRGRASRPHLRPDDVTLFEFAQPALNGSV